MKTLISTVALVATIAAAPAFAGGVQCDSVASCKFLADNAFNEATTLSSENAALKDLNAELYARLEATSQAANDIAGISEVITNHKARAGANFDKNPVGFITFAFSYIEDLQRQLGLR